MTDSRDTASGTSARQRLRAVHDRQAAALAAFVSIEARTLKAQQALAKLEAERTGDLGELADVAGVQLAAEVTGMAASKIRESIIGRRRRNGPDPAAGWHVGKADRVETFGLSEQNLDDLRHQVGDASGESCAHPAARSSAARSPPAGVGRRCAGPYRQVLLPEGRAAPAVLDRGPDSSPA